MDLLISLHVTWNVAYEAFMLSLMTLPDKMLVVSVVVSLAVAGFYFLAIYQLAQLESWRFCMIVTAGMMLLLSHLLHQAVNYPTQDDNTAVLVTGLTMILIIGGWIVVMIAAITEYLLGKSCQVGCRADCRVGLDYYGCQGSRSRRKTK